MPAKPTKPPTMGEHLRAARAQRGWTISQLATASQVSAGQISELERDLRQPNMRTLFALCRTLGIKPSKILDA